KETSIPRRSSVNGSPCRASRRCCCSTVGAWSRARPALRRNRRCALGSSRASATGTPMRASGPPDPDRREVWMTDRDAPPRANWREFFDQVTQDHEGDAVTVEVIGVDYGDQLETEPLPSAYIEYDVKDE